MTVRNTFCGILLFLCLAALPAALTGHTAIEAESSLPQNETPTVKLQVSNDVWPCFPNHFFSGWSSISSIFEFEEGVIVEVTSDAEFLSGNNWLQLCTSIYVAAEAPVGSVTVAATPVYPYESSVGRMSMEQLLSYPAAFEIWQKLSETQKLSGRIVVGYALAASSVELTFRYASICGKNQDIRELYPDVCDYAKFSDMMDVATARYEGFTAAELGEATSMDVRDVTDATILFAQEQFKLITPWEKQLE